jgi:hypothetical protein
MTTALHVQARNAATDAIAALANGGDLLIYTAGFGTLLASAPLASPAYGPSVAGVASLAAPITGVAVIASGTAAAYRITDSLGVEVLTGSVGTSDADLIFANVTWTAGDLVDINGHTITTPATE